MAKQLNVNIGFSADTSQAKAQIQDLQKTLFKLQSTKISSGENLTKNFKEAQTAAQELSIYLNKALDVNTGKLDLTKFNASLKASGTNISQLSNKLLQAGTQGQNAFIKLSQTISQANYPMVKMNAQLDQMLITLKNTARWQLSSSMLHGFMGALSSAYGYVQDLDSSLNKIMIVTGQSENQMAAFASQANAAAKELSATTTAYTDAALIFYQQGLNGEDVKERTDAVIKMAHATGDSAEEVSSYMTAIWNNFDNGSESLEHYADVITALGASTASSSSEIASGLSQFAAIAETTGLSYDYATSALATLVANTRQSADTIGNSLKTIFSRLQGLSLGETLEDGTNLNKYSKALQKVGVDIKDASGELRDMDNILDDLASKWDTLGRAEKGALAQTVAGTRQYTQLISLMDSWDDMKKNLTTAKNAEGTLDEQAEIYANSWEGAKARVKAAAQEIYATLLDKDVFKNFLNAEEKVISGLGNIIETMGGLKGVIVGIGSLILSSISSKIGPALAQMRENIAIIFTSAQTQVQKFISQVERVNNAQINSGNYDAAQKQQLINANQLTVARAKLSAVSKEMTDQEKQMAEFALQNLQIDQQQAQSVADTIVKLEQQREVLLSARSEIELNSEATRTYTNVMKDLDSILTDSRNQLRDPALLDPDSINQARSSYEQTFEAIESYKTQQEQLIELNRDVSDTLSEQYPLLSEVANAKKENIAITEKENEVAQVGREIISQYSKTLGELTAKKAQQVSLKAFGGDEQATLSSYQEKLQLIVNTMPSITKQSEKVRRAITDAFSAKDLKSFNSIIGELTEELNKTELEASDLIKIFQQIDGKRFLDISNNANLLAQKERELKTLQDELNNSFNSFNPEHLVTGIERITMLASAMGQVAMMASSLRSIGNAITSPDMSGWEKFTTILMSFSMLVPSAISSFNALKTVLSGTTIAQEAYVRALTATTATEATQQGVRQAIIVLRTKDIALEEKENAIKIITLALAEKYNIALTEETAATVAETTAKQMKNGVSAKEAMTEALVTAGLKKETAAKIASKFATDALSASIKSLLGPIGLALIAITALVTAFQAYSNHQKELAEEAAENRSAEAKASQEAAEKVKELNEQEQDLYKTYINLKTSTDNSSTAKEQLKTATEELCEALGVEWDALDKLQGKYDQVNQSILKERSNKLQESIKAYDTAIQDNEDIVEDKIDSALDEYDFGKYNIGDGKEGYYANVNTGLSTNDEEKVLNALVNYLDQNYSNIYDKESSLSAMHSGEALRFKEGVDGSEVIEAIREGFAYIRDNAEDLGISDSDKDDSEAYQWLRTLYNDADSSDLISQINTDKEARDAAIAEWAQVNAELAQAQTEAGLTIDKITNADEYAQYKDQYVSQLKSLLQESGADMSQYTDDVLNDMADKYLSTYTNIAEVIENSSIRDAIKEKLLSNGDKEEDIDAFLNKAEKDNTLDIVAQVVTNSSTIESLTGSMGYIQELANQTKIQAQIDFVNTDLSNLKEGMSAEDYQKFFDKTQLSWGEGMISMQEFMSQTYTEQVTYLQNLQNQYKDMLLESTELSYKNGIEEFNKATEAYEEAKNSAEEARQALIEKHQNIFDNSELSEKINNLNSKAEDYEEQVNKIIENNDKLSQEDFTLIDNFTKTREAVEATGQQIENFANAIEEAADKLNSLNAEKLSNRLQNLDADLNADDIMDLADAFYEMGQAGEEGYESIKDLEDALDAAERYSRLSDAIEDLADNWEDYCDVLKDVQKASNKADKAMAMNSKNGKALQETLADLLDVNEDLINADLLDKIDPSVLQEAADGSDEAVQQIRNAFIDLQADTYGLTESAEEFKNYMNTLSEGDAIDLSLDTTQFIEDLIQAEFAAGMTAEEIESSLSGLGIDCDLTPLTQSMLEAEQASLAAGDAIVDNLSFDAEGKAETNEQQGITQDVSTNVDLTPITVPWTSDTVETDPNGNAQKVTLSGNYTAMQKTVTPDIVEQETTVAEPVVAMKVSNPHKSAGGNIATSNKGRAAAPRASRGGRGGRGRGSRGRARERSDKDPKRHRDIEGNLKDLKDEIERYHEINNTIDDVNERLKDYDTIAERAFGKSKVNAINKQVKAYKELANTLGKKLNENAQYLDQDKSDAKSYGWKFDKNGNVSNYDERMAELVAQNNAAEERYLTEYNQAVAWWNSLSGDAQSEEGNKKKFENMTQQAEDRLEDAQKLYDKSVESLKTYEETVELREDLLREQQEAINNAIDKELEAVDAVFQTRIKVNEADIKLLDELISNLGEGADAAADAIGRMGEKMKYLSNETYAARDGIQGILEVYKDKDLFGDNALSQNTIDRIINGTANEDDLANILAVGLTEDTIDKLQDYQNQLYETNESMRQLREDALEKTSEAFTEYTDSLDKTSEKITHLQKVTTTYKNIIDIIGKKIMDSTGDLTNQLSRSNWELQRNNTHALKSELNFIDESMNNMKSAIAELQASNTDGVHDVAIKNMQKQLQDMEETRDSTYESWLDSWEAEVQAAADIYQETLDNIVNNFQDSLGGLMGSLDALSEAYNRKSEIDDIYVDDYEKIYNLSKLTRDIEKSIDDTDNIKSKQALRDLLEEMNELQEDGIELSTYDLENARRRYELELAKQKLQEAQEAKSQVRMTRDSEGNYGYVYTADESAVADAEQNYEDKLYAMQKANAEYIQELQNNIISAQQNCADALANLDATQFASYEEFQAAVAQIQEDYNALMEGYYQQINTALDNNQDLYNTEWQEYSDMTGYKISADEDYVDKFEETTYSLLTGYETLQDAQNAWTESVINATNAASEAWFRWYEDNQIALSDGETSMQDYASTVSDVTDTVLDLGEQMEQEAEDLATSYTDSFDTILDALQNFTLGYDSQIEKIISSNNQLQESINKVIRAASNLADATDKNGNTKTNNSGNGSSGNGGNGSSGGSGSGNGGAGSSGGGAGGKASWDRGYAAYKRINAGAWGNGISNRISKGAKEGFTESEVRLGQQIINYTYPPSLNGKGYSLDKAKSLLGYDTGGYTGAWGNSDGKLALLHQKELVLNADDTENFLKAVDIIRDISQTIDLNALSASNSLATMLQSASTSGSNDSQVLEQEVHITADFSGVKDRSEIEAAFDNLINRAAQFANRKK